MINVVVWLVCGVLAGSVASHMMDRLTPTNAVLNSVAGVLGALIGGVVFLIFDTTPLDTLSLGGCIFAFVGAILVVSLVQLMFRRPI